MKKIFIFLVIIIVAGAIWLIIKPSITPESAVEQKQESLTIKGSDTELQLVSNLVEVFNQENPEARISVTGGGSGTGIAALLNGEIDIANSSRPMKDEEWQQAKNRGLDIKEFILARDGLSIIVHPSSIIEKLTVDELGGIYRGEITNWKELNGNDAPIVLYGRQTTSGTYVFFRDTVLKGDYDPRMKNMEGTQAIVDAVKNDKNGIGYVGRGYIVDESGMPRKNIKIIKIAAISQKDGVSPLDIEAVKAGVYPLTRPIFQYLVMPTKEGASLIERLLRFEASLRGSGVVEKTGFFPPIKEDTTKNEVIFELLGKQK